MNLTKSQERFINSKTTGISFLKGKNNTGKTTASIYRSINLINNYCLYNDDKVLFLTNTFKEAEKIREEYNKNKESGEFNSLFSYIDNRIKFSTFHDIISESFSFDSYIDEKESISLLSNIILDDLISNDIKKIKAFNNIELIDLKLEIDWIRSSLYSLEEYLTCKRSNKNLGIRKNSKARNLIYKIKELYESNLENIGVRDYIGILTEIKDNSLEESMKFTHIVIDLSNKLSNLDLILIQRLYKKSNYSSMVFVLDSSKKINYKNSSLKLTSKEKSFICKLPFREDTDIEVIKEINKNYLNEFKYINLKNKREISFNTDSSSIEGEISIKEDNIVFNDEELLNIPVFNEIAAGEPIEINDEFTENFKLPKAWLERGKESFILKVKGNSMIDKNIFNGDLVVIKRQATAYHNDIVAVALDGEATLKTLNMNTKYPSLMPANPAYLPISLENKEVAILGVAIGIIKH